MSARVWEPRGAAAGGYICPLLAGRYRASPLKPGRAVPPGGPWGQPKHGLWTVPCLARARWRPGRAKKPGFVSGLWASGCMLIFNGLACTRSNGLACTRFVSWPH
jgi:hypothetical protein